MGSSYPCPPLRTVPLLLHVMYYSGVMQLIKNHSFCEFYVFTYFRAIMMAQRVKALATKLDLSLIPRTLTVAGEIQLFVSGPFDTDM